MVPPLVNWRRTIASFDETVCDQQFRFLRNHLTLLCELLHFPEWVIFDNRSKMLGEEVFLRGLYEIRSGSTHQHSLEHIRGSSTTYIVDSSTS